MTRTGMTIGVHGSGLARTQAETLGRELADCGADYPVHLEIIQGLGENNPLLHDDHEAESRSEVSHLQSVLRSGEIDVVIHRGFDLRGEIPEGLRIGAVLPRQNPYDVLLGSSGLWLDELDETHRIGVVQLRARAQLLDYRDDLDWELIDGNASDWLTAMIDGDIDALIAPGAAIEQLGLQENVCEIFPPELLVPAPGSGVLVCLVRTDDELNYSRLRILHDEETLVEYTAESALVESLGGIWEQPIGVLARLEDRALQLSAMLASPDGAQILRDRYIAGGDDPVAAGAEFAALLIQNGADKILDGTADTNDLCPPVAGELTAPEPARDFDEFEDLPDFEDFVSEDLAEDEDEPV